MVLAVLGPLLGGERVEVPVVGLVDDQRHPAALRSGAGGHHRGGGVSWRRSRGLDVFLEIAEERSDAPRDTRWETLRDEEVVESAIQDVLRDSCRKGKVLDAVGVEVKVRPEGGLCLAAQIDIGGKGGESDGRHGVEENGRGRPSREKRGNGGTSSSLSLCCYGEPTATAGKTQT